MVPLWVPFGNVVELFGDELIFPKRLGMFAELLMEILQYSSEVIESSFEVVIPRGPNPVQKPSAKLSQVLEYVGPDAGLSASKYMAAPRVPLIKMCESFPGIDHPCVPLVIELLGCIEIELPLNPALVFCLHSKEPFDRMLSFLGIDDLMVIAAKQDEVGVTVALV
jgi:hypothetical protein